MFEFEMVQVTDTNDNAPAFTEAAYSFDIPEDTGRGAFVGSVSVSDLDEGVNAQVSYTVLSDWGNDVFSLNPQSGVFTLTSRLDYEQVTYYNQFFFFNFWLGYLLSSNSPQRMFWNHEEF